MNVLRRALAAFALAVVATLPARAAATDDEARVIVKYRADGTLMRAASAAARPRPLHAAALGQRLGLVMADRWVLGSHTQSLAARGIGADELARRLAADPDVEWAAPVRRKRIAAAVPDDPYFGPNQASITPAVGQWYLRAPDSTFVSATNAVGAWALTTGSAAVTVAVLDTGVRFDHPDFRRADGTSKLHPGYDFVSRGSYSTDGDGRDADASDPGDWSTSTDSCGASGSSWHGTQTAGIVGAATDNRIGMASVGRDVMVLPVRVLARCGGFDDDIQAAMLWSAGIGADPVANPHPAKVLNMSLGSDNPAEACDTYQPIFDQLTNAGVTVVVAAGNAEGLAIGAPANCRGALVVTGLRHLGTKVGFSSVGPEVTIAAPGGNCVNLSGPCLYPILTTTNAGDQGPGTNTYSDSSNPSVGTSFAAPQVAGAVALMLSADPTLTPAAIRAAIRATARPFPTSGAAATVQVCHAPNGRVQDECYCTTATCGAGMIDIAAAVAAVTPTTVAPPSVSVVASTATPVVGQTVTLDSLGTGAFGGRSIASYEWTITSGAAQASFSGATTGATAALVASGVGPVTVRLTVVDSGQASASQSLTITVQTTPPPPPPPPPEAGGGGGGGASSAGWLALLALGVAALSRGRARTPPPPPGA